MLCVADPIVRSSIARIMCMFSTIICFHKQTAEHIRNYTTAYSNNWNIQEQSASKYSVNYNKENNWKMIEIIRSHWPQPYWVPLVESLSQSVKHFTLNILSLPKEKRKRKYFIMWQFLSPYSAFLIEGLQMKISTSSGLSNMRSRSVCMMRSFTGKIVPYQMSMALSVCFTS